MFETTFVTHTYELFPTPSRTRGISSTTESTYSLLLLHRKVVPCELTSSPSSVFPLVPASSSLPIIPSHYQPLSTVVPRWSRLSNFFLIGLTLGLFVYPRPITFRKLRYIWNRTFGSLGDSPKWRFYPPGWFIVTPEQYETVRPYRHTRVPVRTE